MAFHIIKGVMGSGKSYYGAELCLQAWREGAIVHTNLPLCMDEVERRGYLDQTVLLENDPTKWVYEKDGKPSSDVLIGGVEGQENILVFDEAALVFDVDTQATDKARHKPIFQLIALCRHVGLDLYFLAQHESTISAKLRVMCETQTKCIKAERIPFLGWLIARLPMFGDFLRIVYMGQDKTPYARTWHKFRKEVGSIYRTHGMRESVGMRVEGTRRSKGADASKKKGMLLIFGALAFFVIAIGSLVMRAKQRWGDIKGDETAAKPGQVAPGKAPLPSAPKPPGEPPPAKGPKRGGWRLMEWDTADEHVLTGVVRNGDKVKVFAAGVGGLQLGGSYYGEPIVEVTTWGGWWYFLTSFRRLVVVRPIYQDERAALPPVTIQGKRPEFQFDQTQERMEAALERGTAILQASDP